MLEKLWQSVDSRERGHPEPGGLEKSCASKETLQTLHRKGA